MAVDRTKVLATAQKYLGKGNYERAIAEYKKLVGADPSDMRSWQKIAELYYKKGAHTEAAQVFFRVAEHHAKQGFFHRAVGLYRQILKLQPSRVDVSLRLAAMYENLHLVSDALGVYEQAVRTLIQDGNIPKALDIIGKMVELDPDNIPLRIKYAEALSRSRRIAEAADEFEKGAELLREQGRIDDYLKVAERLLYHRPEDTSLARQLAELYLQRNDAKRALAKLQLCFKKNPRNIETLGLLARAFHVLGQSQKTISVYREMARICEETGDEEKQIRFLEKILELDPRDAEAAQALAALAPVQQAELDDDEIELLDDDEILLMEEDEIIEDDLVEDVEEEEILGEATPDALDEDRELDEIIEQEPETKTSNIAREAQLARLLTECDVFLRYGLKSKVLAQYERILKLDPNHVETRERLKQFYIEEGETEKAIEQLHILARLHQQHPDISAAYRAHADSLREEAASPSTELATNPELQAADVEDDDLIIDDEDALIIDDDSIELAVGDEEVPFEQDEEKEEPEGVLFLEEDEEEDTSTSKPNLAALEHEPTSTSTSAEELNLSDPDIQISADSPHSDEAFLEDPAQTDRPPSREARPTFSPPIRAEREEDLESSAPSTTGEIDTHPPDTIEQSLDDDSAAIPIGEIEETLDEADFFLAQGLFEAARATIVDALDTYSDHPALRAKLDEITQGEAVVAVSVPPPESPGDDAFALAEKLAEELDEQPDDDLASSDVVDVDAVFAQFKKGVEEQIGIEDSDTHFDLGIAYKEMGLLDDAVHEFELAMRNPQRECTCHTMIGLCRIEQGKITDGISSFKKGLYSEVKGDREELSLYFELGQAYEKLNDPQEALYYYQKVAKRNHNFRGVDKIIDNLTNPQSQLDDFPTQESGGEAFGNLFGDD